MSDVKYYPIDENAARRAHEMNSFRQYAPGRTTERYQSMVDAAAEKARQHKERVEPIHHEKIDALLDRYARKLAAWYNRDSAIEQMCPSIMISGGGNFPVRRKEKQNAARNRHMEEWRKIAGILSRIKAVGTRTERRIENPPEGWKFVGGEVVANADDNRLQIFFAGKPGEDLRHELKSRGFRWAPSVGAWQRQLTNNAVYAAKAVVALCSEV